MILNKFLSSLRGTYWLMLGFGFVMGILFTLYSAFFFGSKALTPFYAAGCIAAGTFAGMFCYYIIKRVLKVYLERQLEILNPIAGEDCSVILSRAGDALTSLLECNDVVIEKVLVLVEQVSSGIEEMLPRYYKLTEASRHMLHGNEEQVEKVKETLGAVEGMHDSFAQMLREIEEISGRASERASISTEMSTATDAIAETIKEYSSSVLETSASIEEMAMSLKETSENIDALAGSTEQTASSIFEISATIGTVRDNTQRTAEASEMVQVQAQEGMRAMAETLEAMRGIEQSSHDSLSAIQRLALHTARVGEILNVIKEVVEQTNLLSLNASIIAAQAGERGKAFAVVAEEVRALAHRTSASTREIEALIKNIQQETVDVEKTVTLGNEKVSKGVIISSRLEEALKKIEESAAEASEMVKLIASATMDQALGSRLISEEADKNLERVKQVNRAIQEQEKGTTLIVKTLEHMRQLAKQITTSTQEQAHGNKLYLKSVLEDTNKVMTLREEAIQQMQVADQVLSFVSAAGILIEANASVARQTWTEIESIRSLSDQLKQRLESFRA